jgi:tryptophan 2,3-dioxygenase
MAITYWQYIKTEELLSLQHGIDDDESKLGNDEVMFITIHQIDELWFKLVLRELVSVRDLFAQSHVPEQSLAQAVRGIRRMALLFQKVADHFELMETMTPRDYLGFRDKLSGASGFQSAQVREIEILLGLSDDQRIAFGHEESYRSALYNPDGSPSASLRRVERRAEDRPTLREAIDNWLWRTPIDGSRPTDDGDDEAVRRFIDKYAEAHARVTNETSEHAQSDALTEQDAARLEQRFREEIEKTRSFLLAEDCPEDEQPRRSRIRAALAFIESYRELPLLSWPREVIDAIVALEQSIVIWRQRHARMVERMIGRRTGTGGSAGVDYIDRTALTYRVFDDFWAVRTLLIRHDALPELEHPEAYGLSPGD